LFAGGPGDVSHVHSPAAVQQAASQPLDIPSALNAVSSAAAAGPSHGSSNVFTASSLYGNSQGSCLGASTAVVGSSSYSSSRHRGLNLHHADSGGPGDIGSSNSQGNQGPAAAAAAAVAGEAGRAAAIARRLSLDLSHHSLQPPGSRGSVGLPGPLPGGGSTPNSLGRRPSYDIVSGRRSPWDRTDMPAPRSGGAVLPSHFLDATGSAAVTAVGVGAARYSDVGQGAEQQQLMRRQSGAGGLGSSMLGPEVMITAPRAPRAQRLAAAAAVGSGQDPASRERRKSERRLSRGAQIAASWNTCQVIESR
jgi:hypothetical protein